MARNDDFIFNTSVDDELYAELQQLVGQPIVHFAVWEDSMVEALAEQSAAIETLADDLGTFDVDLYLQDGVFFELYSTAPFESLDSEPMTDAETLEDRLFQVQREGLILGDVAVDEEEGLVLVLHSGGKPVLFLAVGGWVLEDWDELPV